MFGTEFLIKFIVGKAGEYLIVPATAAKYAKHFIRLRDYLNLLFPVNRFPVNWEGTNIDVETPDKYAVPIEVVKEVVKEKGWNIPWVKGM